MPRSIFTVLIVLMLILPVLQVQLTSLADVIIVEVDQTDIVVDNISPPVVYSETIINGRLLNVTQNNLPVENATVNLYEQDPVTGDWRPVATATTDANGIFVFRYTPTSTNQVTLRIYYTGDVARELSPSEEIFTITPSERTLSITPDTATVYTRMITPLELTVSDSGNPPASKAFCYYLYHDFQLLDNGLGGAIRGWSLTPEWDTTPDVCSSQGQGFIVQVEFANAGIAELVVSVDTSIHASTSKTITLNVVKQTPELDLAYVSVTGTGEQELVLRFLELDRDPAIGLPVTSIEIDGVPVQASYPIYTDTSGYVRVVGTFLSGSDSATLTVTTAPTDSYEGSTYTTVIDLRRPVSIVVSPPQEVYTLTDIPLQISVVDAVDGNPVGEGSIEVTAYYLSQGRKRIVYSGTEPVTASQPIQHTIPASMSIVKGPLYLDVYYSGSPQYKPYTYTTSINVRARPLSITASYASVLLDGQRFIGGQSYTIDVASVDTLTGNTPVENTVCVTITLVKNGPVSTSRCTPLDAQGTTSIDVQFPTEGGAYLVEVEAQSDYYEGRASYSIYIYEYITYTVAVGVPYTITYESGVLAYTARLYQSDENWTQGALIEEYVVTSTTINVSRVESQPGIYYYLLVLYDAYGSEVDRANIVVIAKYNTRMTIYNLSVDPVVTDTIFAYVELEYYDADGQWKPVTWLTPLEVYEVNKYTVSPATVECRTTGGVIGATSASLQLGDIFVRSETLDPANPTVSLPAYRYAGVGNAPDLTYKLVAPETDLIWGASQTLSTPVLPLSIVGTVTLTATNSRTGETISQTFSVGGASYPFTISAGDTITLTIQMSTEPYDLAVPGLLSIYGYSTDPNCPFNSFGLYSVYTGSTITVVIVPAPGSYSGDNGPIRVIFDDSTFTLPSVTIAEIYVDVLADTVYEYTVVTNLPSNVTYKKGYGPLVVSGIVFGLNGEAVVGALVSVDVYTPGGELVYSTGGTTDSVGMFTIPIYLDGLADGSYNIVVSTPEYNNITPSVHGLTVISEAGTFFILSTPEIVPSDSSFALLVQAYIGDPIPIVGEEVNIWYSNIIYTDSDPLTWTFLGTFATDDSGSIAPNLPPEATQLDPGREQGTLFVLVDPLRDGAIDPNTVFTTTTSVRNLQSTSNDITTLASEVLVVVPELLSTPPQGQQPPPPVAVASDRILGGTAEPVPAYSIHVAMAVVAGVLAIVLYTLKGIKRRYVSIF